MLIYNSILFAFQAAYVLNYRVLCNTTFTFSNVVGPQEVVTMSGNPVTFLRVNTSSIPHVQPLNFNDSPFFNFNPIVCWVVMHRLICF